MAFTRFYVDSEILNKGDYCLQAIPDIQIGGYMYGRNEQFKRCSRASDSSSAYSSMMQLSIDDAEDLPSNLAESLVDSDDEEGYGESTEVNIQAIN